jgi:hypothetical protein
MTLFVRSIGLDLGITPVVLRPKRANEQRPGRAGQDGLCSFALPFKCLDAA